MKYSDKNWKNARFAIKILKCILRARVYKVTKKNEHWLEDEEVKMCEEGPRHLAIFAVIRISCELETRVQEICTPSNLLPVKCYREMMAKTGNKNAKMDIIILINNCGDNSQRRIFLSVWISEFVCSRNSQHGGFNTCFGEQVIEWEGEGERAAFSKQSQTCVIEETSNWVITNRTKSPVNDRKKIWQHT